MSRPVYIPPMDPARITAPSREIYARMGEDNIVRMIEDFYRELEGSSLRALFPADMAAAAQKSAAFFVGLLGGPPLYHQRHGNPMMRARHILPTPQGVAGATSRPPARASASIVARASSMVRTSPCSKAETMPR
ncbi:MAG TPA: hypothetical protein VML54_07580 [Candidatus Limnocylindrales bacterium]|nr:hypothetical protein [Candidatus Limnocylindrales bacterium]